MAVDLPSIEPGMNKNVPGDTAPPATAKSDEGTVTPKRKSKKESEREKAEDAKLIRRALKRFKRCLDAESKNRSAAVEDLKFLVGDQWPVEIRAQREADRRPCLTANSIPTLVHQVANDIRQNRPAIHVSPVGDQADKTAAELFAGMIRAIERESAADVAYDTAITHAVQIGFGYCRILTEYEPGSFNQTIRIDRIRNPFSVSLDPSRQQPDGSDIEYAFISEMLDRDDFESKWPDADPVSWTEKGPGDDAAEWITKGQIRVAEYFELVKTPDRLVQLSNGWMGWWDDVGSDARDAIERGETQITQERQADRAVVKWYKLTATQVLERRDWAGSCIPVFEFLGEEVDQGGKVVRSGIIRNVKDAQRMKNYWLSYKTEIVALAPKAPFVGAEGQFEGYEDRWRAANTKSFPYLEYVPISLDGTMAPPPQRQPPTPVPSGVVEAEQSAEKDMMATSGIRFNGSVNERLNDESGSAIRELRRNNDIGSFHFMDNACRTLRHIGRALIELIPRVYDTRRVIAILREDDSEQQITIDPTLGRPTQKAPNANDAAARLLFNPSVGKYGCAITTGPSYATRRIEAHDQMLKFAAAMPQKGQLIAHLIAKYSDWPGSDEIYKLLVKALPPQLLTPDLQDVPPQVQQFVQSLQGQLRQLMAERMQMLKDLTDNRTDQATKRLKVDRDFEAKVLATLATLKSKMMQFDRQDLQTAIGMADTYPQGFPQGIPDPMGQPGVPGMPQAPGAVPGLNGAHQVPPNIQRTPVAMPPGAM